MIDIDKAMDSKKFELKINDLVATWTKEGVTEEEKTIRLQDLFEAAAPFFVEPTT